MNNESMTIGGKPVPPIKTHPNTADCSELAAVAGSALADERNLCDTMAAALLGDYPREDALAKYLLELCDADAEEIRIRGGVPIETIRRHARVKAKRSSLNNEVTNDGHQQSTESNNE